MQSKNKIDKPAGNRFTSEESLTEEEFKKGIRDAEAGPFYTVQESMKRFELWLKQRKKK